VLKGVNGLDENNTALISDEMSKRIVETAERIVMSVGAEKITVRMVLQDMGITNRVFYNRFHNINEVLNRVYESMVLKIRESITAKFDPEGDFFSQVVEIVANTLVMSYEYKMKFNQYVFESDSIQGDNFTWWKTEIAKLIDFGIEKGHLRKLNT
jgi:AcrR family transcriptional regulator